MSPNDVALCLVLVALMALLWSLARLCEAIRHRSPWRIAYRLALAVLVGLLTLTLAQGVSKTPESKGRSRVVL